MTLAAVWKVEDTVYAIADTRIIRSLGNVLTEHGPKILPVSVLCKQPGESGFFDRAAYSTTIGYAYAGASLTALATHAMANILCQNLVGYPDVPPPRLDELAVAIAEIAHRYIMDIGELSGPSALFSALIFGWCDGTSRYRAFQLSPKIMEGNVQINVTERDLYTPESLIVIGSCPNLLLDWVSKNRSSLYANPDVSVSDKLKVLREIDLPRRGLSALIAEGADETVGGTLQEVHVVGPKFEPIAAGVSIIPPLPSGRNMASRVLGFDMFDFNSVGSYFFSVTGRILV